MKKRLLLITLCFSVFTLVIAQDAYRQTEGPVQTKVNYALSKKINTDLNPTELLHVLVKGDISIIKSITEASGGTFKYSSGGIASVAITIDQIANLISSNAIERVEAYPPTYHPMNDSVLLNTNTLPVHAGTAPLPQPYDGTGVVTGFIDTGIDWTHGDFNDALGNTRIKYIWDQAATPAVPPIAAPPIGYTYGIEWDSTSIANATCTHNDTPYKGHGTHVVGKASGSAMANGSYLGIAPNADIIMVSLDFSGLGPTTGLTDAVQYIYAKALAMGKPCVINASLGTDVGSHDGLDLESQLIKSLIDANPGQAFVAAAGNSGEKAFHLAYDVTADTNFTMFTPKTDTVYFEVFADTSNFKGVNFAIGADQMLPVHSYRGRTKFSDINAYLNVLFTDTIYNNGNRIGTIVGSAELLGGVYSLWIAVLPDSLSYNWRFMTTGSGNFDLWNFDWPAGMRASPIVNSGLPSAATMPDSMYYKLPDTDKTVASGFQSLDNVITVGNYYNRKSYTQVNGSEFFDPTSIPGERVLSSAVGPTRDGRIKPEICSPGNVTMAAVESVWAAAHSTNNALALGGLHFKSGFTSHSAPGVAGIAALYLQKNPTATAAQVRQAIIKCPIQDEFTGNSLPNNEWGYGKVNAYGALVEEVTTTQPRDTTICEGNNATITTMAIGTGLSYQWISVFNGVTTNLTNSAPYSGVRTNTLSITSPLVSLSGTQYRCVVSNTYSCDITSDSATLTINALPTITTAATATDACFSTSTQSTPLTYSAVTNTPTSYSISWGATAITAGFIPITNNALPVSPISIDIPASATAATYTATITVKNVNNCTSTDTDFTVTIGKSSIDATTSTTDVCFSANTQTTQIAYTETGTPTTLSLSWDATATTAGFLAVSDSALPASPITVSIPASATAATYTATISVKNSNNCLSDTDSFTVTINTAPVVTFIGLEGFYCYDATLDTLTGTPTGGTFSGTGITDGTSGIFDAVIAGSGTHIINYAFTNTNNCAGTSDQSTRVYNEAESADSCEVPPLFFGMDKNVSNIFTPNGDGINDEFQVNYNGTPASDFNLSIYDRWGNQLFSSTSPNVKWDGRTAAGVKVSAGTYFYVLVNDGVNYKGHISLFK